ncbi:MAG: hypothetical protein PHH54_06865 [Candidatus Nanoarchaeia archaeon]|nr:hypothetical protein [Candidatus Nanoarchaeia archaeon]
MTKKILQLVELAKGGHSNRTVLATLKDYAYSGAAISYKNAIKAIEKANLSTLDLKKVKRYMEKGELIHLNMGEPKEVAEYSNVRVYIASLLEKNAKPVKPEKNKTEITLLKYYEQIKVGDHLYVPNPINYLPKYAAKPVLVKVNSVSKDSFSYSGKDKDSSIEFSGAISGKIPDELMIIRKLAPPGHLENLVGEGLFYALLDKKKRELNKK